MINTHKIFEKFDKQLFTKIDQALLTPFYKKLADYFTELTEKQQKVASRIISICSILSPLLLILIVYSQNSSIKSNIEIEKEILENIQSFYTNKQSISYHSGQQLAPIPIRLRSGFDNKLRSILSSIKIKKTLVTIEEFDSKMDSGIIKTTISLQFKDFQSTQVLLIFKSLINSLKVKVYDIEIKKNSKELLNGKFTLKHYAK